jgi:alpha-galactosidase
VDAFFDLTWNFDENLYTIRDLWAGKDIGTTKKPLMSTIPGHDVLMLRLQPKK